ncbi:hypothetical protein LZ32DRAFT_605524 [Colletotrichum eremochloae]|nr:hypothetical protein LZ32DRAFT_605524 [Colletotrichum eremochloae]
MPSSPSQTLPLRLYYKPTLLGLVLSRIALLLLSLHPPSIVADSPNERDQPLKASSAMPCSTRHPIIFGQPTHSIHDDAFVVDWWNRLPFLGFITLPPFLPSFPIPPLTNRPHLRFEPSCTSYASLLLPLFHTQLLRDSPCQVA